MLLSIITCSAEMPCGSLPNLERPLQASFGDSDYEWIILHPGSTSTDAIAEDHARICRVHVPEISPAARNHAARLAQGDVLLFMDDLHISADLVPKHLEIHRDCPDVLVVGAPVQAFATSDNTVQLSWGDTTRFRWLRAACEALSFSINRKLFLESGGFSEDYHLRPHLAFALKLGRGGDSVVALETSQPCAAPSGFRWRALANLTQAAEEDLLLCRQVPELRAQSPIFKTLKSQNLAHLPKLFRLVARVCSLCTFRSGTRIWRSPRMPWSVYLSAASRSMGTGECLEEWFSKRLPVLMYHSVDNHTDAPELGLTISPKRFTAQMQFLAKKGFTSISPAEWMAWVKKGAPLPRRPVLITFDDGYRNLLEHAVPVLQRYGFRAVVFVPTGLLGTAAPWDNKILMTAAELRLWQQAGLECGAHSRHHPRLVNLADHELTDEVAGSMHDLEPIIGGVPLAFAYPEGSFNASVVRQVSTNFPLAFTTDEGLNTLETPLHLLRRTMVQPSDGMLSFFLELNCGFSPLERFRRWLHGRLLRAFFSTH